MTTTEASAPRTIRPLQHLHWTRTAAGNLGIVVPGAAVGITLAVLDHDPVAAALLVVVLLLTAAVVVLPALRIRLVLDRDGVQTFWRLHLGRLRVARQDVRRAVTRSIYNGDGVSTSQHLFLLGADGRPLIRMSDRWWTHEQLLAVAHHMDVAVEHQPHPVHLAELRRSARVELTWRERHRLLANAGVMIGGFVLCFAFAALVVHAA